MKRTIILVLVAGLALVAAETAAQESGGRMPMGGQAGPPATSMMPGMMSGAMCPMMGGMMGGGMEMMPGMAGGPMMGMMGGSQDPKVLGRMLQMRADMMRAMADVLARHGKAMEEGK